MEKLNLVQGGKYITLKSPIRVTYDLTAFCSLRCMFCYVDWDSSRYRDGERKCPELNLVLKILDRLKTAGVLEIVYLGGEPFEYEYYLEAFREAYDRGILVGFASNGIAITREKASRIAKYVDSGGISFCGPSAEIHDTLAIPKPETRISPFEGAVRGLRYLTEAGVRTGILYDPLPVNYMYLYDTVKTLIKEFGIDLDHVMVNRMMPEGRARKNWERVELDLDTYKQLFYQMEDIENEFGIHVETGDAFPFCSIEEENSRFRKFITRCDYGVLEVGIDIDGYLRICPCESSSIGNTIAGRPLEDIWATSSELRSYRELKWLPDECGRCPSFEECGGGCPESQPDNTHPAPDTYFRKEVAQQYISMLAQSARPKSDEPHNFKSKDWPDHTAPKIATRYLLRDEQESILCIPVDMPIVVYASNRPILRINDVERDIILMSNGRNPVGEISKAISKKQGMSPKVAKGIVDNCLNQLEGWGYL